MDMECLLPKVDKTFPYFSILFCGTNRLVLLHANKQVEETVERNLKLWDEDAIKERVVHNAAKEYRLKGSPFTDLYDTDRESEKEGVAVKRLLCSLLADLSEVGWQIILTSALSAENEVTWFFEKVAEKPSNTETFCISFNDDNKLQMVNGSDAMMGVFKDSVARWISEERLKKHSHELTLKRHPFQGDNVMARRIILKVLQSFNGVGFVVVGTFRFFEHRDIIFFQKRNTPDEIMLASLNDRGRIRLIDPDVTENETVKKVITENWTEGLQKFRLYEDDHYSEFKLNGNPWGSDDGKVLLCLILERLAQIGWVLYCALDISTKPMDKCVLVFSKREPIEVRMLSVYPSKKQELKIANGPKEVVKTLSETLISFWPVIDNKHWLKSESFKVSKIYEISLNGAPWAGSELMQSLLARHQFIALLLKARELGYALLATAGLAVERGFQFEGRDCWIFASDMLDEDKGETAGKYYRTMAKPPHFDGKDAHEAMAAYCSKHSKIYLEK